MSTPTMLLGATEIARLLGQPEPTPEQQAVIEAPPQPLLVVAGAGSGKTETMAARVVYLIANGIVTAPDVLGLTFTRKAAAELADRIRRRLRQLRAAGIEVPRAEGADPGVDVDRPSIATYNSFAADLTREHALRLGMDPDARLITEAGSWQLATDLVLGWRADLDVDASPAAVTEAVLALAGSLNEHLLTTAQAREEIDALVEVLVSKDPVGRKTAPYATVAQTVAALRERAALLDVVDAFTRAKRERGLLDFGDQVQLAARIAESVPEVGAGLRERYRVVLLDEFQDTSVAQLRLLAALFGGGHAVTAVGDPNQAIYGWRGASAAALADFPRLFPTADGTASRTAFLTTSWRNDVRILEAANAVSAPLRVVPAPQATAPGADVPELAVPELTVPELTVPELTPRPGAGAGEVLTALTTTLEEESALVADFFAQRWDPTQTAAVLCRTRAQFTPIVTALRERGIPVEVLGLGGLLATPEVADLRATLQAAHDASRGDALMRMLTGRRLGITDLHALADWARVLVAREGGAVDARAEASLVEAVETPPPAGWRGPAGHALSAEGARRVTAVRDVLRHVRSLTYLSLPELLAQTIAVLGLDIEVAARADVVPARARANLDAIVDVASGFASDAEVPTLGAFLAWLDAAEQRERGLERFDAEPEPGAVQVLTVHAAKGLEWDVVAVAGLVETQFPSYDGVPRPDGAVRATAWLTSRRELPYPLRGDAATLPHLDVDAPQTHKDMEEEVKAFRRAAGAHAVAEERRLAYVALTRARSTLLLTGSWFRTGKKALVPSRFLLEPRRAGLVTELTWADEPEADATNPSLDAVIEVAWPQDPVGARRGRLEAAAAAVRERAGMAVPAPTDVADPEARRWLRDAELLLAERTESLSAGLDVPLGAHLSASAMVGLVRDPRAFALERRRPVPAAPSEQAELGTRFHAWVERYYAAATLLDLADLTDAGEAGEDAELTRLQATFSASPWAQRVPVAVEVDVETPVAGTVVRCRIDAVFDDGQGVDVVDWKTGTPPRDKAVLAEREIQLALYRLAWARHSGRPLAEVRAAFYYVGHDLTVRAGDLDEETLTERVTAAITRAGG
ncbi:ATP-dependent helicase [Georgenia faecalis]|uniref:ATP-dependent helicase n=1 Tax=Georgenia faecalis TaxID=2483799 RepID=UPI000FD890FD|nr:ATP-dependent DNA helicase [Georgenia faecalis]